MKTLRSQISKFMLLVVNSSPYIILHLTFGSLVSKFIDKKGKNNTLFLFRLASIMTLISRMTHNRISTLTLPTNTSGAVCCMAVVCKRKYELGIRLLQLLLVVLLFYYLKIIIFILILLPY